MIKNNNQQLSKGCHQIKYKEIKDNLNYITKIVDNITSLKVLEHDDGQDVDWSDYSAEEFFLIMGLFNAQRKASLIEDYIIDKDNGLKIPDSLDKGDYKKNDTGEYVELKTSTSNKGMKLNIRQIRPWQEVDYYLCSFINETDIKKSKFYLLTREQMHSEVHLCGAVIHGTKQATANNVNKEYGINFPVYNDKNPTTKRWNDNYISSSYYDIIIDNK